MAMARGLTGLRQLVLQAATPRVDATRSTTGCVGAEGRPATIMGHDEQAALRRDQAFVEAAAVAALRGARV